MVKKIKDTLKKFMNYMNDGLNLAYRTNPMAMVPAGVGCTFSPLNLDK